MRGRSLEGKVALVTGASSGIGAALADEYARRGADVVLAARRADRLDEVAATVRGHGRRALAVSCDVTVDGDLERAVAAALGEFGRIDRAIANAGFGVAAPLAKLELDDFRRQFETNVFGVLRTVYATLEPLAAVKGRLAIIGSVSGFVGMPGSAPYAMSKAAVHLLGDCLRHELAGRGVGVTVVVPGFVDSEIRRVDNRGRLRLDAREPIPPWLRMRAPKAAHAIVGAVERRRRMLLLTGHGRAAVLLQRFTPGLLHALIGRFGGRRVRDKT